MAWPVLAAAAAVAAVEEVPSVAAVWIAAAQPERDCSAAAVAVVAAERAVLAAVATCIEPDGIGVVQPRLDTADIAKRRSEPSGGLGSDNSVVALECNRRLVFGHCQAEKSFPTCFLGCCRGSDQAQEAGSVSV